MGKLLSGTSLLLSLVFLVACDSETKIESCEYNGVKVDCKKMRNEEPKPKTVESEELISLKVKYSKVGDVLTIKPDSNYYVQSVEGGDFCKIDYRSGLTINIVGSKDGIDVSSKDDALEHHKRFPNSIIDNSNYVLGAFYMFDEVNNRIFQNFIIGKNQLEIILHCY